MKLEDKGPVVVAPILKGLSQKVSEEVQSWSGVIGATHWTIGDSTKVNGADFYFNSQEIGHIHLNGTIHLLLTKKLAELAIRAKLAQSFPWGENWVQFKITDDQSAAAAVWLFKLAYDRATGVSHAELEPEIAIRQQKNNQRGD